MGFQANMDKLLEGYGREEYENLLEAANAISADDKEVAKQMEAILNNPLKYFKENAERYGTRGIHFEDEDLARKFELAELLHLGMVDELEEQGYLFEVDWKCELEDFLWALEQLKGYCLISDVMNRVELDENDEVESWIQEINATLDGKAYISYVDINSDCYPLVIVSKDAYKVLNERL